MKNNKKILIVEDEELLMEAAVAGLSEESKFTVLKATNGEEGLKVAFEEHPDLILLDIMMPVMGGIEMLEKLREDEWGKNVKVIFLTVLNDLDKLQIAIKYDVNNYLMKQDWKIADIVEKIKKVLQMD